MHISLLALATGSLAALACAQQPGFPTYSEILTDLSDAATNHPTICQFVDLTATYGIPLTPGGNSLYAVKISDNVGAEEDEPSFLMVSAHHGNEYGTPIIALDTIARLTQGYGSDPTITALVDEYEIWVAPCWNPDNYPNNRNNANGVDLNRNYPFLWNSSCNTGLAGPSPASEVETQTMVAWSEDQRFTKVLDFHSSGRECLFGYRTGCGQHVLGSYLQDEATLLSTASGYGGQVRGPSSNGEHYQWQLGRFSNYAFLTEISNTQSPTFASATAEAATVWPGTVWMLERPIPVWGRVTDGSTGQPLEASITYVENPFTLGEQNHSEPNFGRYHAFLPAGTHTLRFELAGYQTQEIPVSVVSGNSLQLDVSLSQPGLAFSLPNGLPASIDPAGGTTIRVDVATANRVPQPGTGTLSVQSTNGTQSLPMTELSPNVYEATMPGFPCGDSVQFSFSAEDTTGQSWQSTNNFLPTSIQVVIVNSDAFEVPSGWTGGQPGDTAIRGIWDRRNPDPTAAQPDDDHTPTGTACWVTDGRGGSLGQFDVDGGHTTLLSPALDLTVVADPSIRYWRWFSNNLGSNTDDEFAVEISNDNGTTWVRAETVGVNSPEASGGWFPNEFRVADFVTPSAQVRIRFIAEDQSPGSIVEAAVDDFEVFETSCDGEVVRGSVGCPDSTGAVLRIQQLGSTRLNGTLSLTVESGAALPYFLVVGFNDTVWNGTPLPTTLSGTGCLVSVNPEVSIGLVGFGANYSLPIPASPGLAGIRLFWQGLLIDPQLTTQTTIATTDNVATMIGN
ncbi:MAG: M14 family zinc carboxypeptidase [Planctomycetota bacterium]|nr:M14 family zinc carboxypeptidase [Planctomycetota bacterium]